MANKWDPDTTLQFIQCYKEHECLWNFSSPHYKNRLKRDEALNSIVDVMQIEDFGIIDVKNKIKNLRSTYCQELKKTKNSENSGNEIYVSNIKWLPLMEEVFAMAPKKRPSHKRTVSVHLPIKQELYLSEHTDVSDDSATEESMSQLLPVKRVGSLSTHTDASDLIDLKPNKRFRGNVMADSNAINEDESLDIFGKSVAMQLKNLSVENALRAQQKIQCILTEIGIHDYRMKTRNIPSSMSDYDYNS